MLLSARRRASFCESIAIEMGGVSRYFSKILGSRAEMTLPSTAGASGRAPVKISTGNHLLETPENPTKVLPVLLLNFGQNPDLLFLAFLDFLAFLFFKEFLAFWSVFPFFPKDFRGFGKDKKSLLFWVFFPAFF